jgi:hypothetical protein
MGQFTIFLSGCAGGMPVRVPASSVQEVERSIGASRFIAGELIDFPDEHGVCSDRSALIPISRIQMIVEDQS